MAAEEVMCGRAAERAVIRDLLTRAQQGHGGMVLVDGEAGMGKSLLLRGTIGEAAAHGFSLAAGAADPLGQVIPFFALRAAFPEAFAVPAADGHRDLPDVSASWISRIHAHLEQWAAAGPVLVCLDDVQWAGQETLAALRTLPGELKWHPVAWVLARCPAADQDTEYLFSALEKDGAARISLGPLDDDAVKSLLATTFGGRLDESLLALAGEAAGHPALLAELVHGLAEDKAVQVSGDRSLLMSARLPERVVRLAQRRLDGLSDQARHLTVTAAVLGPSFGLEDAAEMLDVTPAGLLSPVEEAIGAGIMMATSHAFSFQQQLLGRAVGETIPRPVRKALHRQYSRILLSRGAPAVLVAGHLLQAAFPGDHASLADLDAAAAQALNSAPQTAADLALRAMELTPPTDPGALPRVAAAAEALTAAGRLDQAARITQPTLAKPLPPELEARLRCALSSVLSARGQVLDAAAETRIVLAAPQLPAGLRDQATAAHLQALAASHDQLAGRLADTVLAERSQHDSRAVSAALVARAAGNWDRGRVSEALELLRNAAGDGAGISLDARDSQPLLALAAALTDLRQLSEVEAILRIADSGTLRGIPAQTAPSMLRARIYLASGQLLDATAAGQTALATADALGATGYASAARCVLGVIALRRGDTAAAADYIARTSNPPFADMFARAETTVAHAQISEARYGADAAIGQVAELCTSLQPHRGLLLGDPVTAAWLTRTALIAGHDELAAIVARSAGALASANPGYPALSAAAAHSLGLIGQNPSRLADAAAQHPDPWARASAAEDLGVLHARQGDRDQAVHQLTLAVHGYQATDAAADAARVRRRLRKLGVRRRHWTQPARRPVTGWDSLTETERAVSGLVAQGLNNAQIASQMYVSVHTVASHLRQIFRKLDISKRVELARIVIQRTEQSTGPGSVPICAP